MVPALAFVALGQGSTALAHMTSPQANIAPSSPPQDYLAFLNIGDTCAAVGRMTLSIVATHGCALGVGDQGGSRRWEALVHTAWLATSCPLSRHNLTVEAFSKSSSVQSPSGLNFGQRINLWQMNPFASPQVVPPGPRWGQGECLWPLSPSHQPVHGRGHGQAFLEGLRIVDLLLCGWG